ncbi:hypothetical protein BLNAU_14480 [Blattamonas nauphoetae]|uniref:Uncharacterized protein n=1 Tax=Blattamonas nauphoetae TaxID=2049346 RepID=A0ABQ9XDM5_9EUKA|nr:hypothetical protein BLNAU_14480 [Blattamonas nauphoetae]
MTSSFSTPNEAGAFPNNIVFKDVDFHGKTAYMRVFYDNVGDVKEGDQLTFAFSREILSNDADVVIEYTVPRDDDDFTFQLTNLGEPGYFQWDVQYNSLKYTCGTSERRGGVSRTIDDSIDEKWNVTNALLSTNEITHRFTSNQRTGKKLVVSLIEE